MNSFQDVLLELSSDLQEVDNTILKFAVGKSPLIQEISSHLILSGGKRIRPVLVVLAAKLCQTKSKENIYDLAAAVELIHSATLLHDDVVDQGLIRRGKKTANAIWDNKASILVGDYLFSVAFQLMVRTKNLEVLELLSKTSSIMSDGEVMQLENSNDTNLSSEKYFEIIFGKTAVLFTAACKAGALIGNASRKEITALEQFGHNLGMVFQIVDDILDYTSSDQQLGKEFGHDFFEGKVTLPVILTAKQATLDEQKLIADIFLNQLSEPEKNFDNFNRIFDLIKKYDGINQAKNIASNFKDKALEHLAIFPESKTKQDLTTILKHSLERVF